MDRTRRWERPPLYLEVVLAVALGTAVGVLFGQEAYLGGLRNEHLGRIGLLFVTLLRVLAIPLIFFAILETVIRTRLPLRQGLKLVLICLANVSVAIAIGLGIMNVWEPGRTWTGYVDGLLLLVPEAGSSGGGVLGSGRDGAQGPFALLFSGLLRGLATPFSSNNVIGVVLLALVLGTWLRRARWTAARDSPVAAVTGAIERLYQILVRRLEWIVRLVPLAVFGVLAHVVGKSGIGVFSALWIFLAAMLLGLLLHALLYYPACAWLIGGKAPRVYMGQGVDAIVTAVSCNSSLATVPVTLHCLARMRVSTESARLAACVGTNLNNDGITLYEAMAALFLAQALGFDLPLSQQLVIVAASIVAGAGVAGIPEAGLIVLPLVLSAAGLPEPVIVAAIPLIMAVDWLIARVRSGVNVMSDMVVAILLDAGRKAAETVAAPHPARPREHGEAMPQSLRDA